MNRWSSAAVLLVLVLTPLATLAPAPLASTAGGYHAPVPGRPDPAALPGQFSFVSNFEDGQLDGWAPISGPTPQVTASPSFSGDPSLTSTAGQFTPQIDTANQGFVTGLPLISFQVAIDAGAGSGVFGLGNQKSPVAVVGVSKGEVVAGGSLRSLRDVEPVPSGTSYPRGWVYLTANVNSTSYGWVIDVFVDNSNLTSAVLSVPAASGYTDAIIETTSGTVHYTDVTVLSYPIPLIVPGYNNMEGYGQGSGENVNLLPAYYELSAQMTLDSWSIPQDGILSMQINAMNTTGTLSSTCVGFFQLGTDIDSGGTIQPWYVTGVDCSATYFTANPIPTPPGTHLVLSIVDDRSKHQIRFTIDDTTTGRAYTASIPYRGSLFFSSYTQLEFQPCCNAFPIQDYRFVGSLYDNQITTKDGRAEGLTASYMVPFLIDTPSSWDFTYYQTSNFGYQQIA